MTLQALAFSLLGTFALSGPVSAGSDNVGLPTPDPDARGVKTTYSTRSRPPEAGKRDPGSLPQSSNPGDRIRYDWTACNDTHCTDHYREDRYQREDAPKDEDDPNAGSGAYGWVAVRWGSQRCAPFDACRATSEGDAEPH